MKVSCYCKACEKRVKNGKIPRCKTGPCYQCRKKYCDFFQLNTYIKNMNDKYETNVPYFEMLFEIVETNIT